MLEKWQAVVLGLVEGITEYLPISSTGHLILATALLGLDDPASKPALDDFAIVVQGGAILAVLGLYWARVRQLLRGLVGVDALGRRLLVNLFVAFLPAAFVGFFFDDWVEARLFQPVPVLAALALGGVWMIWLGGRPPRSSLALEELDWRHALAIGGFQAVAIWPGTSRSMMTIAGGALLGLRAREAAEFSFLLGLPTLGAACGYKLAKNLAGDGPNLFAVLGTDSVLLGIAVATISAAFAVRWLVGYLERRGLGVFGWYRLALAGALGLAFASGWITLR